MKRIFPVVLTAALGLVTCVGAWRTAIGSENYLGFDRNVYPGDDSLGGLRRSFRYAGYWLNNPPGETANSWRGKRAVMLRHGFGFLVLFNGRLDAELKGKDAAALGSADGRLAAAAALNEGFAPKVLIFLDQEEGGRLLPEQAAYILTWAKAVREAGDRAGVYCSGIEVPDGTSTVSTARDLSSRAEAKDIALWVANDACPPSKGCAKTSQGPAESGVKGAAVWQYALSPRRSQFSSGCLKNAALDGNCYAPGVSGKQPVFVDMDIARTPDPSGGSK